MSEEVDRGGTPSRIPARGSGGTEGVLWFFIVLWYGFIAFGLAVTKNSAGMLIFLALVGLFPTWLVLSTAKSRVRFGASQFEMLAPAFPGGRLEGVVHVPHAIEEDSYIRINLICKRVTDADSADAVLYRTHEFVLPPASTEAKTGRIPVRVEIPATCTASDPAGTKQRCYWWLQLSAERGCPGLDITFEVPVSAVETR